MIEMGKRIKCVTIRHKKTSVRKKRWLDRERNTVYNDKTRGKAKISRMSKR